VDGRARLRPILVSYPRTVAEALVIVDFQNDFTPPDGALAVPEGDLIADRVNELARSGRFELVVATRDWHPPDHGSFDSRGGVWPVHCVQDSEGAELHAALDRERLDVVIDKGQRPDTEGYSGFEGTELAQLLRERGVDSVTIVGLATDYCVSATALDAARLGFGTEVLQDAIAAVDLADGDGDRARAAMAAAGCVLGYCFGTLP
jgi:nicotinamidase/pyrazinamidase